MQSETPIVIDDGVARVGSALEAHHHIGGLGQQIDDLALALVAPVCPYNRFYHDNPSAPGFAAAGRLPSPAHGGP